ncbi:AI-2E family transporter [Corallococcus sp. ZKHCc1 1396]|uniref:AI-2E family transporter n=1 Tax=Corallococcus soli TaxID=2710757 RepID=A0ABR9PJB7_9BACT|nr:MULTISPECIES: AI-2E family transporter [Corallococcus]MBE4748018.1 AI-2E family transporter [Corallococcus soli]MCY1033967.1 AI-2E family transporter [Corallococcus sp. BB11-1]RYZ46456.1 MAG: AI-2E family transporter [Myxococcaceae bacterium]
MASDQVARRVFVGLILLSILLLALVIRPFAEALFLAAVLAGTFHGLHTRLKKRLRGHGSVSASVIVLGILMALLLPLGGLTAFVVAEVSEGVRFVTQTVQKDGMSGLVEKLPSGIQGPVTNLIERLPLEQEQLDSKFQEQVTSQGGTAARAVTGAVAATGTLLLQATMMLIALFFFLTDGERLVQWVESVSPLRRGQTRELLREFRGTSVSVLVSTVATAGVQAVAALVGFIIVGVPAPLFFAGLTFFLALIPAVGAAVVVLLAAGLMFLSGHPWAALFLTIWGVVVVGLVDNVVKPLLAKKGMNQHGAIIFFALLGGLAAFGAVGLLLGPLIVAFFLSVVRIFERDYGRPNPRLGDPATPGGHPVDPDERRVVLTSESGEPLSDVDAPPKH